MNQVANRLTLFSFCWHCRRIHTLLIAAVTQIFRRPLYLGTIIEQMEQIGVRSLSIVLLTNFFTGMVLALQTGYQIARFGAKVYIGVVVALSIVRELGPVLTALVVAGRVGSGIAAELGSMKVTEQIDAMRAMGTDPIKKLVTTRLIALLIMLPALTIVGDFIGIIGGMLISVYSLGLDFSFYKSTSIQALSLVDIFTGMVKPVVFAVIIVTIGCYLGLNTTGGTQGVGKSTTYSVVVSSILIFLFDFLLVKVFFLIFEV
ncbi:MAG: ABC transporter permease [candidate division Zixibacteria bacterium]|nr:ABC transporter permease [candidate division Zixibacteria bacterium]